jgi:ion channel-forming bestrophin family protein
MYIKRSLPASVIFSEWHIFVGYLLWNVAVFLLFTYTNCSAIAIPFLPISLIGTAVAFYLGFKNNASYERLHDARKNWGAITNDSRAFVAMLNTYMVADDVNNHNKKEIVLRHIAWLYAHKYFLRFKITAWEHNNKLNNKFRNQFTMQNNIPTNIAETLLQYIHQSEIDAVLQCANPATQVLNNQSLALKKLRTTNMLDEFRLIELQNQISKFYDS